MRLLAVVLTFLICSATAFAGGWEPMLSSHAYGPERIVAVDKSSQTLIMLERKSPLHEVRRFPCTTGQSVGDKLVEGDLRTPEGVYFVGPKIKRKLDWGLYGNLAYSLNYPNPIDRINGKTGGGIWIHGRGKEFVPRDTLGCVALKVPDMRNVAQEIAFGTPVVIASELAWTQEPGENDPTAKLLAEELQAWASDWEKRGDAFFSHYDQALMNLSEGRSFDSFIRHKKGIFAAKPWIHVMVDNIRAIPGPDYWVTWFDQYYRAPGIVSNTGKRFYWKKDPEGNWRIVGREYVPASEDLGSKYLAAKSAEVQTVIEAWKNAWLAMDIEAYGQLYSAGAVQGNRRGARHIADYKKTLWAKTAPVKVTIDDLKVSSHPRGLQVAFLQTFEDAGGYSDIGLKTMILTPDGGSWKIESEQWRRGR
ncbi:L,D-transpeptidase family protein [uncultured Pseudodesulfovibrio sp.]|uniref:L,D-transpeptidase family protein n=1 Tax=uncultured Pseudodesulfovibrio sp. TaxID=2035858 RepID=UPI0029C71473|nr:L,D-transpeptidase family protein [uncultured Pseudodesulfovibrio sp.]